MLIYSPEMLKVLMVTLLDAQFYVRYLRLEGAFQNILNFKSFKLFQQDFLYYKIDAIKTTFNRKTLTFTI